MSSSSRLKKIGTNLSLTCDNVLTNQKIREGINGGVPPMPST